jgi:hypothetical protein
MHVTLVGAFGPKWAKRSEVGPHDLKNLQEGTVEYMMGVLGRNLDRGWLYSRSSFRDGVGGVKNCWNPCRSNFGLPNNFVTFLLCGLLVNNNRFLKMCIFLNVLVATLMMVVMKTEMRMLLIIIQTKVMRSLCTLL